MLTKFQCSNKISDKKVMLLLYITFAVFSVFYGTHLSIPVVIDETGTVANTAFLAGDDWSICVQTMGGFYYKYGVSLLYLPLYLIFRNSPFLMYKAIMALHMLLISLIPVMAYYICRTFLKVDTILHALFLAVAGGGISSVWLYSLYSRADAMLILLPWVLALVILILANTDSDNKKKKNIFTAVLAFIAVYAYMAHSRGIVLLIATVLTLLIATFLYKNKIVNWLIYIPTTAVLLVIDKMVSRHIKSGVYGIYGTRHASIENFDFETFGKIFTVRGMIIEIKLIIGWLFNLFASSMGLVLMGFIAAVIIVLWGLKKKSITLSENIFSVFALLCVLGTFSLGALFFFPHAWELMTGIRVDRADRMIYGRYTIGSVSPICLVALYALIEKKGEILKLKSKIVSLVIYALTMALFILKVSPSLENIPQTNARYFISLTGFLKVINSHTATSFPDLTSALLKIGLVFFAVMIVIVVLTSANQKKVLYSTCLVVFAVSFINFNYVFFHLRNDRDDTATSKIKNIVTYCGKIKGAEDVIQQYPAIFISNTAYLTKCYQFALPKYNVGGAKYIRDTNQQEFLIITKKNHIGTAIAECEKYYPKSNYYRFDSFKYKKTERDVIFVRGDHLAELLRQNGNTLTPYTPATETGAASQN